MNKVAQYYRELVASLSERLRNGERDIDALVEQARERVIKTGELTRTEVDELTRAVRRDLEEFAMSYEESLKEESDSVFMRVIKESLWQELADITDKTQLEWREVFQDLNHHGVYHSGEVVGLGNLVCEKCHFHLPIYTPEVLTLCPKCGHDQFQSRHVLGGVHIHRNTGAIILDGDRIILMDNDADFGAVSGQGLIDGVIDHLINKMMQTLDTGIADVHGGTFAYRLKSVQDLDLFRTVRCVA